MAARTRKARHDDLTRTKIKTTQLLNRLHAHAFGDVTLESAQVKSIEILLRKSLPDLSAVTLQGAGEDGALKIEVVRFANGSNPE